MSESNKTGRKVWYAVLGLLAAAVAALAVWAEIQHSNAPDQTSAMAMAQMKIAIDHMLHWEQKVVNQKAFEDLSEQGDLCGRMEFLSPEDRERAWTEYIPQGQAFALKVAIEEAETAHGVGAHVVLPGQGKARPAK